MKVYTKNFTIEEMACQCGECAIDEHIMDTGFMLQLQKLRELMAAPLIINSAYRCKAHNEAVGGSMNSLHMLGRAADISLSELPSGTSDAKFRSRLLEYTFKCNLYGVGIGKYFIHVDNRGYGHARCWVV